MQTNAKSIAKLEKDLDRLDAKIAKVNSQINAKLTPLIEAREELRTALECFSRNIQDGTADLSGQAHASER